MERNEVEVERFDCSQQATDLLFLDMMTKATIKREIGSGRLFLNQMVPRYLKTDICCIGSDTPVFTCD